MTLVRCVTDRMIILIQFTIRSYNQKQSGII